MIDRTALAPWWWDDVIGSSVTYPRGATLNRSGHPVRTLHLITDGVVRLRVDREGRDVFVALRTRGWLLGAVPAIMATEHMTTAVALTECEARALPIADFHQFRGENQAFGGWLQQMLAREAAEQLRRAAALSGAGGRARVEQVIVSLFAAASVVRSDGSLRLAFDLSVTDLATLVASSRESVSRILTALTHDGVVAKDRGWLVVPSGSRLVERIRRREKSTSPVT